MISRPNGRVFPIGADSVQTADRSHVHHYPRACVSNRSEARGGSRVPPLLSNDLMMEMIASPAAPETTCDVTAADSDGGGHLRLKVLEMPNLRPPSAGYGRGMAAIPISARFCDTFLIGEAALQATENQLGQSVSL